MPRTFVASLAFAMILCDSSPEPIGLHNSTGSQVLASQPAVATGAVQGTLLNANGRPVANTTVSITTIPGRGQFPLLVGTVDTDAHGKFKMSGIAPGSYRVQSATLSSSADSKVTVYKNLTSTLVLILQ